ncbi:MAG TPA: alpha/beta hydrolase, partial [Nakamurella sp.]
VLLGLLAWITIQIRRQLPRRGGRWMLYPIVAVTGLAAVGGGHHTVTQSIDQASVESMPGQLIDVGDHRLYLSCTGSGEPTVILEPGLGETSAAWGWIAPTVAAHTRVCVYDRAGRGRSESSPTPQDGDQIATDLHTLLERADIIGPLVMVGHSLGGLYVLDYTARYPQQVAGMVLLDATPPTAFSSLPDYPAFYDMFTTATGLFPGLARLGATELINASSHPGLPAEARQQARADWSTAVQARSQRDELAMVPTMMAQAGAVTTLGDLPLAVLTAPMDAQTGWLAAQEDVAGLSGNSIHLVVPGASHESLLDDQAVAAVSGQAIAQVVDAARTGTPLA